MVKYHPNLKPSFIFKLTKETKILDNGYKTKQRELVLGYLKANDRCLTADEIIKGLTSDGHAVSKTTVYRCLERFSKDGSASKFINEVGQSTVYRYSGGHCDHFHLKCTECGRTVCADCGFINRMQEHFFEHHGFTLSKTQTIIYGLCRSCGSAGAEAR